MTSRQDHLRTVKHLLTLMLPEQREELTVERLVSSYAVTEDEAKRILAGWGL